MYLGAQLLKGLCSAAQVTNFATAHDAHKLWVHARPFGQPANRVAWLQYITPTAKVVLARHNSFQVPENSVLCVVKRR
jgi:hypothetical protein